MKIAFAFSGQGSQTYQMGRALFERKPVFREWMLRLDDFARRQVGRSVVEPLYSPARVRPESFDDIRLSHPAIFMVELALAKTLHAEGVEPDVVIGASLGEFAAAVLGGLLSWEEAFGFVLAQADIFERRCEANGGMLAILAPAELYERDARMHAQTEIAAHGFDENFVISGPASALSAIEVALARSGVVAQRLPVRYAFHSAAMESAREALLRKAAELSIRQATLPVISCATGHLVGTADPAHMWNVVRGPIRVSDAIAFLERQGAHEYVDVGPGGTFTNLVKYNRNRHPASRTHAVLTPLGRDLEALEAVSAALGRRHGRTAIACNAASAEELRRA
jgi:acyl transferase domain-containing protein